MDMIITFLWFCAFKKKAQNHIKNVIVISSFLSSMHNCKSVTYSSPSNPHKTASKMALVLQRGSSSANETIHSLTEESDSVCLLHQHEQATVVRLQKETWSHL